MHTLLSLSRKPLTRHSSKYLTLSCFALSGLLTLQNITNSHTVILDAAICGSVISITGSAFAWLITKD